MESSPAGLASEIIAGRSGSGVFVFFGNILCRGEVLFLVLYLLSVRLPGDLAMTDTRSDDQILASAELPLRCIVDDVGVPVAMQVKLFRKGFISLHILPGLMKPVQKFVKPWRQSFPWIAALGQKPVSAWRCY